MPSSKYFLDTILPELLRNVQLIVVSKTQSVASIQEVYNAGHRAFGENYVQEIVEKNAQLPKEIEWHFIGHLQSNKVKFIAPFISWIHAIDSEKLLIEINKQAAKNNRCINCLLQIHVAQEDSKFGWDRNELIDFAEKTNFSAYPNISIRGIMGMGTFSDDEKMVRSEFKEIVSCFKHLKKNVFKNDPRFLEISMGMSGDWKWAIEEGSTMVRIGSAIFGARK